MRERYQGRPEPLVTYLYDSEYGSVMKLVNLVPIWCKRWDPPLDKK
jgi:hypothetical protein